MRSICAHGNSTRTTSSPSRLQHLDPELGELDLRGRIGNVSTRPPRNVISVSIGPRPIAPAPQYGPWCRSRPRPKVPTRPCSSATVAAWTIDTSEAGRGSSRCTTRRRFRAVEGLGELGHHIVSFVYGDLYTQPALTDRDRELGAVVALTALGRSSQLPQHLRAALHAGLRKMSFGRRSC